jgi:hypothetical protein
MYERSEQEASLDLLHNTLATFIQELEVIRTSHMAERSINSGIEGNLRKLMRELEAIRSEFY